MYNTLVKDLIIKHFGEPKNSLTFGRSTKRKDRLYCYTLENEKEIADICNLLGTQSSNYNIKLPILKQAFSKKGKNGTGLPQCACLEEQDDGHWNLCIYDITGVAYKPYRGKITATLQLGRPPTVDLSDRSSNFYGYWEKSWFRREHMPQNSRDGFSYWINKALKTSEPFRLFSADFFLAVAQAEKIHILKDVSRAIRNCGCFLPPISYENLLTCRTPAEVIQSFTEEQPTLSVNFNKTDLNAGYVMKKIAHEVNRRDWLKLAKLDAQSLSELITLPLFYDEFQTETFLRSYYIKEFEILGFNRNYAEDYVRLCRITGEKFRIGCDRETYRRIHDEMSEKERKKASEAEFRMPLVAVPSVFDELETALRQAGRDEFERIGTTERLFQEGEYQHNCVFSRRALLREDRVSIYRWNHKNTSYTVQFVRRLSRGYVVDEVRARFNRAITEEHFNDLKVQLAGIAVIDDFLKPNFIS